jgi:hypothetical protein
MNTLEMRVYGVELIPSEEGEGFEHVPGEKR